MWSHDSGVSRRWPLRAGFVVALGLLAGGCFQPLYGERSLTGGPGLGTALAAVDVAPIDGPPGSPLARLGIELRNEVVSLLTGGGSAAPPTHRLVITLTTSTSSLIVDPTTARAEFEIVALDANYNLVDRSGKSVLTGSAMARVSYDIPGQQQRLAMIRGQRDAQSRAAREIAEKIRTRLAAHFATAS